MTKSEESLKLKLMYEFRKILISFLDELIEQFSDETDLYIIRIFFSDQVPIYDILGRFIRDLLPLKPIVDNRQQKFFLENDIFYSQKGVSMNKVNHFRELWLSEKLDDSDRETIWKWMDILMKIGNQYYQKFGYVSGWEKTVLSNRNL